MKFYPWHNIHLNLHVKSYLFVKLNNQFFHTVLMKPFPQLVHNMIFLTI